MGVSEWSINQATKSPPSSTQNIPEITPIHKVNSVVLVKHKGISGRAKEWVSCNTTLHIYIYIPPHGHETLHKKERSLASDRCGRREKEEEEFSQKPKPKPKAKAKSQTEMEQEKSSSNGSNGNQNNEDRYLGVAIHSQVIKIKQEMEKIGHPALQQSEIRLALREITQQQRQRQRQRSRSPLGLGERPISVGGS